MSELESVRRHSAALAWVTAALLVLAGILASVFAEADYRAQRANQAQAHAAVLAESVSAALAFEDAGAVRQAMAPLTSRPDVRAVGIYGPGGDSVQRWSRTLESLPERLDPFRRPDADVHPVSAIVPVAKDGAPLGWVWVRLSPDGGASRTMRSLLVLLLLGMAGLLTVVLVSGQRALLQANQELAARATALEAAYAKINAEIEERRRAQDALAQAQKLEAIGQLTGGVAHDFNNLLMIIASGLRLLEKRDDPEKRASILAAMSQAVDRGATLTNQLLVFARRQRLSPEVVQVAERLESLRPLLERSIRQDILLTIDIQEQDGTAKVDPGQFDIALLNLTVNARDAMPNGGRLNIRLTTTESDILIEIIDTGAGMSPDVLARATDPFFTTKPVGKGTGLGLSQVHGFATQSGGRLDIQSAVGEGTTITLSLPRCRERAVAAPKHQATDGRAVGGAVLVVEDDDTVARFVCALMGDLGYTVVRKPNPADALAHLESGATVDLVFTDVIMPGGMNGLELAREVRKRHPRLPVVLTTGYAGKEEFETQGFDLLRKPYQPEQLARVLAQALSTATRSDAR